MYIEPLELPAREGSEKEANRKDWGRVTRASGQDRVPRKKYLTGQKEQKHPKKCSMDLTTESLMTLTKMISVDS